MNIQNANVVHKNKHKYVGYTQREKLVMSILLSIFAPFMLFFLGPFEIYGNNSAEFGFVLGDFVLNCLAFAFVGSIILFALLFLLRSRAFDICFGLIFGISLMLFIQGNYLNAGMNSLEGDGVGDGSISTGLLVLNVIIWCVVILGSLAVMLLLNKYKETVKLISTVALVALTGMLLISFISVSLSTNVYSSEKSRLDTDVESGNEILTVKNLDTLAKEDNIVMFVVDRFDHSYFEKAQVSCPEIFNELEGFTYFDDYVTLYPRTYPAIVYTLTGVENDFEVSREQYMADAYSNSEYLSAIKNAGYDINIYTDDYYGYENAAYMREYTENTSGNISYKIVNRFMLSWDMVRLSLYRYLPFSLRGLVGAISTPTFEKYVQYDSAYPAYSTDMKAVYTTFTEDAFTFRQSDKGFSFIHIAGCHLPNMYDENFEEMAEDDEDARNSEVAMKQSFKIISAYIQEMKRMGVYEDATIIITGDHASIGSDSKDPYYGHITSLLVKPRGASDGEIVISHAQLSQDELFATVLGAAGATNAEEYGPTVFEVAQDENRTRRYLFQRYEDSTKHYENIEYEIIGTAKNLENWYIVKREDLGKSIYD